MAGDPMPISLMTFNINGKGKVDSGRNTVEAVLISNKPSILFAQEIFAPDSHYWLIKTRHKHIGDTVFKTNNYLDTFKEANKPFRKEAGLAFSKHEFKFVQEITDQDKKHFIWELIDNKTLPCDDKEEQRVVVTHLFNELNSDDEEYIACLINPDYDALYKDSLLRWLVRKRLLKEELVRYTYQAHLLLDRCLGSYTNIRTRTYAAVLQHKATKKNILCVSWHGPEQGLKAAEDIKKKQAVLEDVLVLIERMSQECNVNDILIGGDFNLEAQHAIDIATKKGFEMKVDAVKKEKAIDYFLCRGQSLERSYEHVVDLRLYVSANSQSARIVTEEHVSDVTFPSAPISICSVVPEAPLNLPLPTAQICFPFHIQESILQECDQSHTTSNVQYPEGKNQVTWDSMTFRKGMMSFQIQDFYCTLADFTVLECKMPKEDRKSLLCVSWRQNPSCVAILNSPTPETDITKLMKKIDSSVKFSHEMSIPIDGVIVAGDFQLTPDQLRPLLAPNFEIRASRHNSTCYFLISGFTQRFDLGTNPGKLDHQPVTTILDVNALWREE